MTEPHATMPREGDGKRRASRAVRWLALLVVAAVAAVALAALLPRWWAHRVGDQVNGRMTTGIILGLFYGFVFVVLPVAVLRFAFRRRRSPKVAAWVVGAALLLAAPNLLTLAIVVGQGNAAHAGERTLDVEAPGFRYATLAGALLALGAWLWFEVVAGSGRRIRRRADRLDEQLQERLRASTGGAPAGSAEEPGATPRVDPPPGSA